MVESATQFAKSGFNETDAAQLAKVSSMYQNIADEQLSAGEASEFIISQMKAFNITAEDSIHIADAVNNVSNNMSVSSADLARNLGNMSAAMSVGGNTMEESIGLLTGITEITRSAASASRALVTIQSRFNQIVDESSSTGKNLLKWYTEHGIAVKDDAGQLRSLYDVMSDLAAKWNSINKNEQSYFMQQQAGARQFQNLASLLSNFNSVQKATELAYNSSGSAAAENAKVLEGLDAKTAALKATWQDFANKTIDSELVKALLNLANGALKILNTGVGRTITKITLLSGVVIGLSGVLAKVIPGIISFTTTILTAKMAIGGWIAVISAAATALVMLFAKVMGHADEVLNKYGSAAQQLRSAVDGVSSALDEQADANAKNALEAEVYLRKIENATSSIDDASKRQKEYNDALESIKKIYPEITASIDLNTVSIGKETDKFRDLTSEIRDQIKEYNNLAIAKAAQAQKEDLVSKSFAARVEQQKNIEKLRELFADEETGWVWENGGKLDSPMEVPERVKIDADVQDIELPSGLVSTYGLEGFSDAAVIAYAENYVSDYRHMFSNKKNQAQDILASLRISSGAMNDAQDEMIALNNVIRQTGVSFDELFANDNDNDNDDTGGGSGGGESATGTTDWYKALFDNWLAYKDHQLAMDEITEEQYYAELAEMVDKFFKGKSQYQEEYWQYSEKIYAYEKKRMQELVEESTKAIEESTKAVEDAVDKINEKYDSELSRLEEVNDALSDQIEYEKLLDEMAKAREQKKLVYKDGRFQYVQDADAISAAQAKLDEYNRNKSLEASKADIEARRKAEIRQTVLDKMQANSAAWATATSPAEREALHNANVELAKLLEDNSKYNAATGKWSSYAGGTLGATGGISLVGENGPEMRILNRGDGILTSGVTKNLFAWGSTSPSDFVSALKGLMGFKFGSSSNTTVNVNNLELPNVTNAREFVTGLKNLALQYAYERG